jgi:hypothetical protein
MRIPAFALFAMLLALPAAPLSAQEITARTTQGPARVEAAPGENGLRLSITLAAGEPQVFDGVGEALVPLRAGNQTAPLIALDIDRDGIDEIFLRTTVPLQRGVLIVFRWNTGGSYYEAVNFTEDTGSPKPYLIVNMTQPVTVKGNVVEAQNDAHVGGRLRQRISRYRWNGAGFEYTPDN